MIGLRIHLHAMGHPGREAMQNWLSQPCLLAFDFDGTLAPIVANPELARPARATVRALSLLQRHHPVAIITGRSVADVRTRLGFEPDAIVGNHGAEDPAHESGPEGAAWVRALDGLRAQLTGPEAARLQAAGLSVEDKGASIALHYRLARNHAAARSEAQRLYLGWQERLKVFEGKMVLNFTALGAPDKADALAALQARLGLGRAFFAGDDVNDEPVFARNRPDWLTLKVDADDAPQTAARMSLRSPSDLGIFLMACLRWNAAPLRPPWASAAAAAAAGPGSHTEMG